MIFARLKTGFAMILAPIFLFTSGAAMAASHGTAYQPSSGAKAAYTLGIDAYGKGDFPTAIRQLTIACDGGVASGCFFLAGLHYQGKGTPIDRALAARFHAKSCDLGDADGCNNAALQYQRGDGVTQSYNQAISYYRKALAIDPDHATARAALPLAEQALAKGGDGAAPATPKQAFDAGAIAHGRKDFAASLRLYTIACDGRYGEACFGLGYAYENGVGVAPDKARAARLYDQACTFRDAYGCTNLGAMYHDGDGVAQSFDRAIASYRRALVIDPRNEVAQGNIALAQQKKALRRTKVNPASETARMAYDSGLAAYGRNDFVSALRQFTTACDARLASGCYNLGVMVGSGNGVAPDKPRAAKLFATACAGGSANACYNLGLFHDDGTGVARNLTTATAYYAKACDAGSAGGCYNAGVAYDRGDGVTQNTDRAIGFYRRALVIDPKMSAADKAITSAEQRRAGAH